MRILLALLSFALATLPTQVSAQQLLEVQPELMAEETRTPLDRVLLPAEKTIEIHTPASDLVVEYDALAPFELKVSYPFEQWGKGGTKLLANPLDMLKVQLQPARARISVDLTRSPAWSPFRDSYVLTVAGFSGSTVLLYEVAVRPPTLGKAFTAALHHFMLDEPVLLSSINFLWGYRVLDMSFTVILGILLLLAVIGYSLLATHYSRSKTPGVILLSFLFLLLYDARFSADLLRVTAADLRGWYGFGPTSPRLRGAGRLTTGGEGEYRQLGPVHQIAAFLGDEQRRFAAGGSDPMTVAVCYDGTDVYKKQLRYLLYPTPVRSAEEAWKEATHVVFIDTDRASIELSTSGKGEGGVVSCGKDLVRAGELLREFPGRSRVVRFLEAR